MPLYAAINALMVAKDPIWWRHPKIIGTCVSRVRTPNVACPMVQARTVVLSIRCKGESGDFKPFKYDVMAIVVEKHA